MKALAINCTLKRTPAESSCELLLAELLKQMREHGVEGEVVRAVELNVKPGVTSDEGEGDDWPTLRQRILAADIFILGTPIWLGHPSSVCQRVLERLDAFLGEQDERGRMVSYDRVACEISEIVIRASDLIGCVVRTESGERIGRVHDLRASAIGGGWQLDGLIVGRYGMIARMTGSGPDPMVRGNVIPWDTITALDDGSVRIRDSFGGQRALRR